MRRDRNIHLQAKREVYVHRGRYSQSRPGSLGHRYVSTYKIKIVSEQELPSGTYSYESDSQNDYRQISRLKKSKRYVFTISKEGRIENVEEVSEE